MSIVRNNLFEKFEEDSDPIHDMGIGMRQKISQWMEEIGEEDWDWALLRAAKYGKLDFVKYLVETGADIHYWDNYALRHATKNGHFEIVKYLVQHGANPNNGEINSLHLARIYKQQDIRKYLESQLEKRGIKPRLYLDEAFTEDSDPIHDMGIGGDEWKFKNLKAGDILKVKRPTHYQPGGFLVITQDIEKRVGGDYSHTLFHYYISTKLGLKNFAKQFNRTEILNPLGQNWAMDFKFYKDTFEKMPYTLTDLVENSDILFEKFTEDSDPITDMGIGTMKLIKDFINSIFIKSFQYTEIDEDEYLDYCAEYGKYDFVKYLLSIGYEADAYNSWGLRKAALIGHYDIVKLLLENGADPREGNWDALRAAIENSRLEITKIILDYAKKLEKETGTIFKGRTFMSVKSAIIVSRHHANEEVQKFLDDYLLKLNEAFTEDSDPIKDMGIGLNTNTIIKRLIKHDDKKMIYGFEVTGAVGRNKQHLPGSYFKILLYGNDFFFEKDGKKKRMTVTDRLLYIIEVIQDAGFSHLFFRYEFAFRSFTVINCKIDPKHKHFFKPGRYYTKIFLNEKFTENSDPIVDMGIGIHNKITNDHLQDMSILYSDYLWSEPDVNPFEEYPFLDDFRKNEPLIFNYLTDLEKQGDLFFSHFISYDDIKWSQKIMNRKVNNIIKRYTGKYKYTKHKEPYNYHYILGGVWDGVMVVFSNVKFPKIKNSLV